MNANCCPYCQESDDRSEDAIYPSTQGEFNQAECDNPDCPCSHVVFECSEHPQSKIIAEYCKEHGTLALICQKCGGYITIAAVAEKLSLVPAKHGAFLFSPLGTWKRANTDQP